MCLYRLRVCACALLAAPAREGHIASHARKLWLPLQSSTVCATETDSANVRHCRHFRSTHSPKMQDCSHFLLKSAPLSRNTAGTARNRRPFAPTLVAAESADVRHCRHFFASQTYRQRQNAILSSLLQTEGSQPARLSSIFSFSNIQTTPMCDTVVTFEAPMLQNARLLSHLTTKCTTLVGKRRGLMA